MPRTATLALTAMIALAAMTASAGSASAGSRYDARHAAPRAMGGRYYGTVNNYYAPVTIYAAPNAGYAAPNPGSDQGYSYPGYSYPAYPAGYATAPQCDATCYGVGYDWSGGADYGGYAYPAYGTGYGYGYPPANEGQRMDPWAGYNGGPGNGYW